MQDSARLLQIIPVCESHGYLEGVLSLLLLPPAFLRRRSLVVSCKLLNFPAIKADPES